VRRISTVSSHRLVFLYGRTYLRAAEVRTYGFETVEILRTELRPPSRTLTIGDMELGRSNEGIRRTGVQRGRGDEVNGAHHR